MRSMDESLARPLDARSETRGESPEGRGWRPVSESSSYDRRGLLWAQERRVDLQVVDAWVMDVALPAEDRGRGGFAPRPGHVLALSPDLTGVASIHDDLDWAADSDEKDGQCGEPPGAIRQDLR